MSLAGFRSALRSNYWSEAEATTVISRLEGSGLSLAAFARQHGLRSRRLARWRHRLREVGTTGGAELQLLPVRVLPEETCSPREVSFSSLEVVAGGRTVRVTRAGFDAALLRDVVLTLEGLGPC